MGDVAVADVNGDRYSDLLVGLPQRRSLRGDRPGRVAVLLGGAKGFRRGSTLVEPTDGIDADLGTFGTSLESPGDVDRDGFEDLLVGAPGAGSCTVSSAHGDVPPKHGGRLILYRGSALGLSASPAAVMNGNRDRSRFADMIRGAGDLDSDGRVDVIVDARGTYGDHCTPRDHEPAPAVLPPPMPWRRYLVLGVSEKGFAEQPVETAGLQIIPDLDGDGRATLLPFDFAGTPTPNAVAVGDVNGDGFRDLVVGHRSSRGRAYFYPGSRMGVRERPAVTLVAPLRKVEGVPPSKENEPFLSQTAFGDSVTVTDVNGDGFADVLVGAPWEDRLYVYSGARAGPRSRARQVIVGRNRSWFPTRMVAGDFNRDGFGDVAIMDSGVWDGIREPECPLLIVYDGSVSGLRPQPSWLMALREVQSCSWTGEVLGNRGGES